ncbi:hypothetical protein DdX_09054 [Ditylenchus destructor]|uniref:Protein quiver n=1 Tax=Ditylenchus destructor TaxID=166010 RepID=A0AAD4R6J8_9BILA|nr:hypothetical protein DdX_09054 [Ditylenchus destructor]
MIMLIKLHRFIDAYDSSVSIQIQERWTSIDHLQDLTVKSKNIRLLFGNPQFIPGLMSGLMEESSSSSNYSYCCVDSDNDTTYVDDKSTFTKQQSVMVATRHSPSKLPHQSKHNVANIVEHRRHVSGRPPHHRRMAISFFLLLFYVAIEGPSAEASSVAVKSRCYSCASTNMKQNFLTRNRGPKRRKQEPKVFDDLCDLDSWMIREKSAVECDGSCYKWQQVLNNSGVYSYATIRGCYSKMFDLSSPMTEPEKTYNECTARELPFECLDQSSLMEWQCFCNGDYCNGAISSLISNRILSLVLVPLLLFFIRK